MDSVQQSMVWHIQPDPVEGPDWSMYPFDSLFIAPPVAASGVDTVAVTTAATRLPEFRRDGMRRPEPGMDWLLFPLLMSLVLMGLSRALYRRRFTHVFSSVLSSNNMNIMLREGNVLGEAVSLLLFANFLLTAGLVVYLSLESYGVALFDAALPHYLIYAVTVVGMVLFIFLKVLFVQVTGSVFRTGSESSEYVLNSYLFNFIIGVVVMPFAVLAVYPGYKWALHVCWAVMILLYAVRTVRGMMIGLRNAKFSPVLFLLYLCTLEFIPLVFLLKMLIYKG